MANCQLLFVRKVFLQAAHNIYLKKVFVYPTPNIYVDQCRDEMEGSGL